MRDLPTNINNYTLHQNINAHIHNLMFARVFAYTQHIAKQKHGQHTRNVGLYTWVLIGRTLVQSGRFQKLGNGPTVEPNGSRIQFSCACNNKFAAFAQNHHYQRGICTGDENGAKLSESSSLSLTLQEGQDVSLAHGSLHIPDDLATLFTDKLHLYLNKIKFKQV